MKDLLEVLKEFDENKDMTPVQAHDKILRLFSVSKSLTPHKCPICNGNGLVPNGFYSQTSGTWSTSSISNEMCRSCNGSGTVWG